MIHSAATHTQHVPKAELVQKGMELQVTASSMQLLAGRLGALQKAMTKLAEAGEKMAAVEQVSTKALQARVGTDLDGAVDIDLSGAIDASEDRAAVRVAGR